MIKMINKCRGCAVCCTLFPVPLNSKELYSGKYQTETDAWRDFEDFSEIEEYGLNILKKNPDGSCVYLKELRCTIYENRPQVCRDFFCGSDKPEFEGMADEINNAKKEREHENKS
ncbi:MAG: YkgJ family cysteine cluster protein [Candidatus Delongbacteria bacterium]|nr:YkgJ family cysteine cluster protein [Candidatus Delongbacteria bacterium]MDD4205035.1 YkgJ family cysteine cluster protein [Candidatus Delongbacteria bacterium]